MSNKNEKAPTLKVVCPFPLESCQAYQAKSGSFVHGNCGFDNGSLRVSGCSSEDAMLLAIKEYIRVHKLEDNIRKWLDNREKKKEGG